ncbi:uncharacterized protein LOC142558388 [Dermacentor variabilis]|uniref:uncharacterized protein LOC142558388 n=1 Tax=Dermacentor variabilis TaxID=34621 RepID=UPI003F5B35C4
MDVLAENNACGQALLHFVSRGNAIMAEVLRLSDLVPSIFKLDNRKDVAEYGVLLDCSYFKVIDHFEIKIKANGVGIRRFTAFIASLLVIPVVNQQPCQHFPATHVLLLQNDSSSAPLILQSSDGFCDVPSSTPSGSNSAVFQSCVAALRAS